MHKNKVKTQWKSEKKTIFISEAKNIETRIVETMFRIPIYFGINTMIEICMQILCINA